jgi:hypothetical protein
VKKTTTKHVYGLTLPLRYSINDLYRAVPALYVFVRTQHYNNYPRAQHEKQLKSFYNVRRRKRSSKTCKSLTIPRDNHYILRYENDPTAMCDFNTIEKQLRRKKKNNHPNMTLRYANTPCTCPPANRVVGRTYY